METQERNSWDEKGNYGQEAHPPPELLMLSVDGELPADEAAKIESHLSACWACRARTAKIEATIADFVEWRQLALSLSLTPPTGVWRDFDARLDRLAEELGRPRWLSKLRARLGARLREFLAARLTPGAVAVAVSTAVIVSVGLWLSRSPAVSAHELLERAIQSDQARIKKVLEPVMYRRLQLRRRANGVAGAPGIEDSVTWESWRSAKNDLFRQRVADKQGLRFIRGDERSEPALISEIESVFQANQLDARRPLSAEAYSDWLKTVRVESETVAETALPDAQAQGRGLQLTTVVAGARGDGAIIEASLIVRSSDWHPVAERLKVRGANEVREYELSESAYEVMPLAALTVFADPAPARIPPAVRPEVDPAHVPAASPISPSGKPEPTEAELRSAEVAAVYSLHRLQADLGEQIEILRETQPAGERVIVRGLVETAERKAQLIGALGGLPLVTARIVTVEEAQRATPESASASPAIVNKAPASGPDAVAAERAPNREGFRTALETYFNSSEPGATAQRITDLTNRSLELSESALARAWALRRLAENPSFRPPDRLSPEGKSKLALMLGVHLKQLREQTLGLRGRLEPCLGFIAGVRPAGLAQPPGNLPGNVEDRAPDWSAAALAVFQTVSQLDRRLHEMFGAKGPGNSPDAAARQTLADFAQIESALRLLESYTGQLAVEK
jgi:anti-sigma factor RsiW